MRERCTRGDGSATVAPVMAFLKRYDFRWETFDIVVSGRSAIDASEGFQLRNLEDVHRFALSYGYDLENPIENAEVFGNFQEAVSFIRKNFLQPDNPDGLKLDIPRKITELTDVRELFLMASFSYPSQGNDSQGQLLRNMACSVLKVMHTIAHIDKDLRTPYFAECQKQIFDRFYRVIHRDDEGRLFLGGTQDEAEERIDLVAFETKPKKARDSILLKLLHKSENVAEDIFDQVGIRFVTKTPLDSLRVIKFLKDRMILMPPNIKPSRSRNTLVDMDSFRKGWEQLYLRWERREVSNSEVSQELENLAHYPQSDPENPHSSKSKMHDGATISRKRIG
ncbi:TIGR04552 family protein, partial [bacterium]|nr:TIGR04552 family protein [bacterium]